MGNPEAGSSDYQPQSEYELQPQDINMRQLMKPWLLRIHKPNNNSSHHNKTTTTNQVSAPCQPNRRLRERPCKFSTPKQSNESTWAELA
ncbi:hypothetical protein Pint_16475 [Pistacia integerrima]|uniref:Uncharacterized protein n=1 Tax=Pistacia integerrima TaxID=434235 RepID=A0ACC0ZFE1_9ROSI|nr:hypothetical protein Pint_16475 [Pistacia integerrima]